MYRINRSSKFNAKTTEYNGRKYASKLEARVARDLDLRRRAGEFTEIKPQFRIKLYCYLPNGDKLYLWDYIADFLCTKPDGTFLICEAKGARMQRYRDNIKLLDGVWLPDHPEYEFVEER